MVIIEEFLTQARQEWRAPGEDLYNFGAGIGGGENEVEENREIASKDRIIMKDLMQDIEYLASPVADNIEYLSAISGGAMSKNLSALTLDQDIFTEV